MDKICKRDMNSQKAGLWIEDTKSSVRSRSDGQEQIFIGFEI